MSISFYFKLNPITNSEELYLTADSYTISFKEYSNDAWNTAMKRRMESGESLHPDDVVGEYYASIIELRKVVLKETTIGKKIILEINKVTTAHLEFVMKMCEKQSKLKKTNQVLKGSVYSVNVNNNMEQVCMVCGKRQGKLKRCGGCNLTCYCSAECQRTDWKEHKLVCRTAKNIPKNA